MKFDANKYKMMHMRKNNLRYTYTIMGCINCHYSRKRSQNYCGWFSRNISSVFTSSQTGEHNIRNYEEGNWKQKMKKMTSLILFSAWHHSPNSWYIQALNMCVQVWSPYFQNDIIKIEKVQKGNKDDEGYEASSVWGEANRWALFRLDKRQLKRGYDTIL